MVFLEIKFCKNRTLCGSSGSIDCAYVVLCYKYRVLFKNDYDLKPWHLKTSHIHTHYIPWYTLKPSHANIISIQPRIRAPVNRSMGNVHPQMFHQWLDITSTLMANWSWRIHQLESSIPAVYEWKALYLSGACQLSCLNLFPARTVISGAADYGYYSLVITASVFPPKLLCM